jgi:hypothetical protein
VNRKPTLQDTMEANAKAMRGLCALGGKKMPAELEAPVREAKKPRAAPTPSEIPLEHDEQRAFVKWFHAQFPKVLIFAVPNAAMRDYKLAAYLRSEGMFAGIPDIHIPEWRTVIEFKRQKGSTISPEQFWCEAYYKRIGWTHFFGYGFEDARRKILEVANG